MNDPHNKQKALGASNSKGLHTDTNVVNCPRLEVKGKKFATLEERDVLVGLALKRHDPKNGNVIYWAEGWGLVRYLPTLDVARQFLEQIGRQL